MPGALTPGLTPTPPWLWLLAHASQAARGGNVRLQLLIQNASAKPPILQWFCHISFKIFYSSWYFTKPLWSQRDITLIFLELENSAFQKRNCMYYPLRPKGSILSPVYYVSCLLRVNCYQDFAELALWGSLKAGINFVLLAE